MSRKQHDLLPDDECAAFRDAMRGVTRHAPEREAPPQSSLDARPHQRLRDEAAALHESRHGEHDDVLIAAGDVLDYRAPGVQGSVYQRLRRGAFRIGDELDLHGMNAGQARAAVSVFIDRCRTADRRCVRIIHGKGLRSGEAGPVLKRLLDGWLRRRSDVLAFTSARREHGGAGAVYVLLRR